MVSEFQGNDSDPVEIEQYTEIFLLTQIRLTLIEIREEVLFISKAVFMAGLIAMIVFFIYLVSSLIGLIFP